MQKKATATPKKRISLDKDLIADLEASSDDAEQIKGGGTRSCGGSTVNI